MRLSDIAVKKPVTTVMMILTILLLGLVSLTKLSLDILPQFNIPVAIVSTQYTGVGPHEIESLITRPVEEALATVSNVKNISSISSEGSSIVIVQFNDDTSMDFATLQMREKVDMIKEFLPEDASTPVVMKIDPNAMPIVQLGITSGKDLAEVQRIVEDKMKSRLERLPGVASVSVTGGYDQEVSVVIDTVKAEGYGLSVGQIASVLRAENLNLPGGTVDKGSRKLLVRTLGEFKSVEEIQNLPMVLPTGGTIYLKDVADIRLAAKDTNQLSRMNGKPSISITIYKQSTFNTVKVADAVNKELEKLKKEIEGIEITTISDQSIYINQSIGNVASSGMLGGFLAILILYLFLRNLRTTFIIGISIPISIIATFSLMYFAGVTLNLMTLGGLALGIGMLVDNSIVVLENIFRFREEGYSRIDAAKEGASEVAMAVTASTLTTVAVFLPIVFVEGITSMLFKELAMTVTFSLLASLLVSLTIVPMLASKILKVDQKEKQKSKKSLNILNFFDRLLHGIDHGYQKILTWSLRHKKTTILIALVTFVSTSLLSLTVGAEFLPKMDEGLINVSIKLPDGSKLEETDKITKRVENIIGKIPEVETLYVALGGSGNMFVATEGNSDKADITVMLTGVEEREKSNQVIADEIRKMLVDIAGAEIKVQAVESQMMGPGFSASPISIAVKGDDLETLKGIAKDIQNVVESVRGTREVKTDFAEGRPEIQVKINRDIASRYGLGAAQVAQSIRNAIKGTVGTQYKVEGTEVDVVIKNNEFSRESIMNFKQLQIPTATGNNVPLEQIADISVERGPNTINRADQVRTITITSDILGRDLRSIVAEIENKLGDYSMPEGYSYKIGGENEDLVESFKSLGLAVVLAILLVYMVLASQFESLLHPFTIMFSVPLAFSGGALGLFLTGRAVSVPAIIGVIILAGIVVNNAIVLIDYINILRSRGMEMNEAIIKAGPTRLRPILMTTLTTVLGLIPLALGIGEGAEMQAPMATVVIGGLTLSTLLTLVFIPVMYTIFDRITNNIKKRMFKQGNPTRG